MGRRDILLDLGKPLEAYDRYRSVVAEAEVRAQAGSKAYAASADSAKFALRSLEKKLAVIDVDAHAEAPATLGSTRTTVYSLALSVSLCRSLSAHPGEFRLDRFQAGRIAASSRA